MAAQEEITLVIFGLSIDNGLVRADVFARKMGALVRALKKADRLDNGGKHYDFLIQELDKGSALATLKERASSRQRPRSSSVLSVGAMCSAVSEGRPVAAGSYSLLKTISNLSDGVDKVFSHGEVRYSGNNVVRLDRFFDDQSSTILAGQTEKDEKQEVLFSGVCMTSFDGTLEVLDGRGQMLLAKLTLAAGGSEVDCVLREDLVHDAKDNFKANVRVTGTGIYDGTSYLPKRFNVAHLKHLNKSRDILAWRGKFSPAGEDDELAWFDEQT